MRAPSPPPLELPDNSAQSLFSVSTRRSFINIKEGLRRIRRKKKTASGLDRPIACICCRDDFDKSSSSYGLPCGWLAEDTTQKEGCKRPGPSHCVYLLSRRLR
ncbi:hypothetical protein HYQ46_011789 [Verticillium longisporum]|nr:hypothetical protein HYQ46_011789 [Verticillium longisporum]